MCGGALTANLADVDARKIRRVALNWRDGVIIAIEGEGHADPGLPYLIPGLVDAHVHIESSMLPTS